jgi:hypothetical protein
LDGELILNFKIVLFLRPNLRVQPALQNAYSKPYSDTVPYGTVRYGKTRETRKVERGRERERKKRERLLTGEGLVVA